MFTLKKMVGAFALCFLSNTVFADDSVFSISGFGTLALVKTNSDDVQYVNVLQAAGASKKLDMSIDSKLGIQIAAQPIEHLSLVAQVVSRKDRDSSHRPKFEWLNAKYDVSSNVNVRVGRMGLPGFLISDYQNVGYATPWVRPPVEVYNQLSILGYDGIDAVWRINTADSTFSIQPYGGSNKFRSYNGFGGDAKKILGANATWETGPWTARIGYFKARLTGTSDALEAGVFGKAATSLRTRFAAVAQVQTALNSLEVKDKNGYFAGAGLIYDDSKWLVETEYAKRHTESFITDTSAWYTTLGYRIDDVTPYVTYSTVKSTRNASADIVTIPQLAAVKAALDSLANRNGANEDAVSIGVRWNAIKGVALKAQLDQVSTKVGKANFFLPVPNSFSGKKLNIYSISADFVF